MEGPPLEITAGWAGESCRRLGCAGEIGHRSGVAGQEGGGRCVAVALRGTGPDGGMGVFLPVTVSDRGWHCCRFRRRLVRGGTTSSDRNPPDRHGALSDFPTHGARVG